MEIRMHDNLVTLDLAIESLDPSPSELLLLFNHQLGALAAVVSEADWGAALERACSAVRQGRGHPS